MPLSSIAAKVTEPVFPSSWYFSAPAWMKSWFIHLLPGCYPSICLGASLVHLPDSFLHIISRFTPFPFQHNPPQESHQPSRPPWKMMLSWWGPTLQVGAASKISKTEEGANEGPTVTSEVICSIKKREDFMLYVPVIQRETDAMATSLSGSSRALL